MKIKRKNEMKVTLVIMVFVMTMIVSLVSISVNFGFSDDFIYRWFKAWGLAFIVATPVVMVIVPLIKKRISKYLID